MLQWPFPNSSLINISITEEGRKSFVYTDFLTGIWKVFKFPVPKESWGGTFDKGRFSYYYKKWLQTKRVDFR